MAYNKSYNPDALPAHAEPEQVAQLIGSMQVSSQPQAQRPPRTSSHAPPGGHPQRVPVTNAQVNKPLPATGPPPASHARPSSVSA
ncbi:hypothetical protein CNMCM6457_002122 [Aspergillus fumigatiaffinis]|nr:hypothetical protein CNMCM6457_002122 [Aspergillus fumigatiaffinis]